MKKLFISLLATICLLCVAVVAAPAVFADGSGAVAYAEEISPTESGSCGTSATWSYFDDTKELVISGTGTISTYTYGQAPWYNVANDVLKINVANGITTISDGAFYGCNSLQEITVPFIGASKDASFYQAVFGYIFGNTKVSTYTSSNYIYDVNGYLANGVSCTVTYSSPSHSNYKVGTETGIWQYSAYDHYAGSNYYLRSYYYNIPNTLTKVVITNATKIPAAAFNNCGKIQSIFLNDEITTSGGYCFQNCKKLTSIELPENLTRIGAYDFYNCTTLSNVQMGGQITAIGTHAFEKCQKLTEITLPNELTTIDEYAFNGCAGLAQLDIPNSVTTINQYAFAGCSNITELNLGSGLKTIGKSAFSGLNLLTEINVPKSVTSIGNGAFDGCDGLKQITLPFVGASRTATVHQAVFGYIFGLTVVSGSNNYYIYDSNGSRAGDSNRYQTTYSSSYSNYRIATSSGTSSGIWQYSSYSSDKSGSYYYLQSYYFNIPAGLQKVVISDATQIRSAAFNNCKNINTIILNKEITQIQDYSFQNCSSLDVFVLPQELTSIGNYAINGERDLSKTQQKTQNKTENSLQMIV